MTTRPTTSPAFATDATQTAGAETGLAPRVDPGAGFKAQGWYANTRFPTRWFNFLLGLVGDWILYLDQKSAHQFNVLNYGADPTGATSSQAAFDDAIAAAAAVDGEVIVPAGIYRLTGLTMPGVSIWGTPATFFLHDHATANLLAFTAGNNGPPTVISDIRFIGNVASTGKIVNNAGARVIFQRCTWNGFDAVGAPSANLQGKIATVGAAASEVSFVDCQVEVAGNVNGFEATAGKLRVIGGRVAMPAAYSGALVYADNDAQIELATRFDCTGHTSNPSGHGRCVYVVSTDVRLNVHDAEIDATGSPVLADGVGWVDGAHIDVSNLRTLGNVDRYFVNATAALGSRIELIPSVALDFASAATVTLPRGVRSIVAKSIVNANVELPTGLFPGQELLYTHFNSDVAGHNVTPATTPVTGTAVPNPVGAGNTLTGVFVWESRDVSGAYRWVQKGSWGTGLTLVA